jgi:hypothetical protein
VAIDAEDKHLALPGGWATPPSLCL